VQALVFFLQLLDRGLRCGWRGGEWGGYAEKNKQGNQ
jgi:hypothetical protein